VEKLREVAVNLMEGWSNMQEAVGSLVKENLELRQAMSVKEWDLQAAAELLDEATQMVNDEVQRQSSQAKRRLWPFG
jgi:Sec-independent protein translocase protein TatA